MYKKIKEQIQSQANQSVPNKWAEIRYAAARILPKKQPTYYHPHRKMQKIAVVAVSICVIISSVIILPKINKGLVSIVYDPQLQSTSQTVEVSNTEPSPAPTASSTTPTKPSSAPTASSTTPTKPSSAPTASNTIPTEPAISPTQLIISPTQPTTTDSKIFTTKPGITGSQTQQNTTTADYYQLPPWDERAITGKFYSIMFNGYEYRASSGTTISIPTNQKTVALLGRQTVHTVDPRTEEKHQINVEIYSMENILSDCAIAVKFEGYNNLYPYINHYFPVNSLSDLLTAIDFKNTTTLGEIEYTVTEGNFKVTKGRAWDFQSDAWKYLFSDTTIKCTDNQTIYEPLFSMSMNCPAIGVLNKSLLVTNDGYIQTNILDVGHCFYIGKDKLEAFKKYVLQSGNSREVSRTPYQPNTGGGSTVTSPPYQPNAE